MDELWLEVSVALDVSVAVLLGVSLLLTLGVSLAPVDCVTVTVAAPELVDDGLLTVVVVDPLVGSMEAIS